MQSDTNLNNDSNKNSKNNTKSHFVWATAVAALLGGNIYQYTHTQQLTEKNATVTNQLVTTVTEKDDLQKEYDAAIARLDDLVSKNTTLNSEINSKDGAVAKLKKEIANIMGKDKKTAADIEKAKSLITALNQKVSGYEEQIVQLKGENEQLTAKNSVLAHEKSVTEEKVTELTKKGSVLHASNIHLTTIDLRRHGSKEKETTKAKKTDLLRITFDIDENRIVENGKKQIFILITNPSGLLLSNAALGSGNMTDINGQNLGYSLSKTIDLVQGQNVAGITTDWHQESEYQKGDYTVLIYSDGYKIGSGIVHLR